jgi:type IV pilus assembly protein PilQ
MIAPLLCAAMIPLVAAAQPEAAEVDRGAGPVVRMSDRGTIEMHFSGVDLGEALQLISLQSRSNIVTTPAVTGSVTASIYDSTLEQALNVILTANGAGYRVLDDIIYVHTIAELAALELAANPPVSRVYRLSYLAAADAQTYVTPMLSEGETVATSPPPMRGIASSADEGGGDAMAFQDFLVVTARPATQERVEAVLKELDVRPKQVLIEATILRAQLDSDNSMGIDFSIVGGVDLELLGATSNGLLDLNLGQLPTDRFERFNAGASSDFRGDVPNGGLSIGIIKDQVGVFLRALETVTDTTVLANPKVLALNKQRGQVIVGRRDGFLTTTVTETQAIQSVEFLETGTQLIFRPFIGEDGFVRVELHPEDSVGFVNAQGLPSEQTTEVTTNVLVRDGHTILIGGLFREVSSDARSQIPGLGDLPGLGQLFRSNTDSTGREEVIILMTIHIIKDHDAYADASLEQEEHVERLRVGLRQGMMWHGRERLAQSHYHKAIEHFAAGRMDDALWHATMAVHNNPRMVAAIELKERITGVREWDEAGSAVQDFAYEIILQEKGVITPRFGRPAPPFYGPNEVHGPAGLEQGDPQP